MARVFDFEQVSLLVSCAEETPKASRIKDKSKLLTLIFASKQKQMCRQIFKYDGRT
jgi:hypothetical protein